MGEGWPLSPWVGSPNGSGRSRQKNRPEEKCQMGTAKPPPPRFESVKSWPCEWLPGAEKGPPFFFPTCIGAKPIFYFGVAPGKITQRAALFIVVPVTDPPEDD